MERRRLRGVGSSRERHLHRLQQQRQREQEPAAEEAGEAAEERAEEAQGCDVTEGDERRRSHCHFGHLARQGTAATSIFF